MTLSKSTYTYDGSVKKPSVSVTDSRGSKISSSYYSVSYDSGRRDPGKYAVKVTFKGNYSGTVTKYMQIVKKGSQPDDEPEYTGGKIKAGSSAAKAVRVSMGSMTIYYRSSGYSYVKFVAPSTGTYKITAYDPALYGYSSSSSSSGMLGHISTYIKKNGSSSINSYEVQTQGGYSQYLNLQSAYWDDLFHESQDDTSSYLRSRYGILRMNAGDTLYLENYFCDHDFTYNLKIAKQ